MRKWEMEKRGNEEINGRQNTESHYQRVYV